MEIGPHYLDKPGVRRNLIDKSRGLVLFFAHTEWHWEGRHILRDYVAEKGMFPCVGWVDVL